MASGSGYSYLLTAEALQFFQALRLLERQELIDAFEFLADHPFQGGDYQEDGHDGRTVEILFKGHFLFALWADHPAKEVRILRISRA